MGGARRRLLPRREVPGRAGAAARALSTGSSGRRTRRGSRASRCSSSSTTSTRRRTSSTRRSRNSGDVGGDRRSRSAGLALAWLVYDGLCRAFAKDEGLLAVLVFGVHLPVGLGRRRALLGARVVRPGRRDDRDDDGRERLLRDHPGPLEARAGEEGRPRARPALESAGKTRSVHNNYLTLPVVFAMLSNHFPIHVRAHARVAGARRADGARGADAPLLQPAPQGLNVWPILGVAAGGVVALALLIEPDDAPSVRSRRDAGARSRRCRRSSRRAARRATRFTRRAPRPHRWGSSSTRAQQIESNAPLIDQFAVQTHAMPLGNVTGMTQAERDILARWLATR